MTQRVKLSLIIAVLITSCVVVLAHARIPQDESYHRFADTRALFGVPNCLNTISNAAFLLVGIWGAIFVLEKGSDNSRIAFLNPEERWAYLIFFLGVGLTVLGSSFYHLKPGDDCLVGDRLPMTLGFMSLLAAVIGERVGVKTGMRLLLPLLVIGAASVFYWRWTESQSRGDLRFYVLVQFGSLLTILLVVLLLPSRYSRSTDLLIALGFYVLAKILESLDQRVFALGKIVSGHTLKHLVAAFATYWILRMLRLRTPAAAS